jgi:hypothetical protein
MPNAILALSTDVRDWLQALSYVSGAIGLGFLVWKTLEEFRKQRNQREAELLWNQAEAAKKIQDEMVDDPQADAAMKMLDWLRRDYELADKTIQPISTSEAMYALRTENFAFSKSEVFVRDSFDALLYYLQLFEHYIESGLVRFEDTTFPLGYYVDKMAEHREPISNFITTYYEKTNILTYLRRYPSWRDSITQPGTSLHEPLVSTT